MDLHGGPFREYGSGQRTRGAPLAATLTVATALGRFDAGRLFMAFVIDPERTHVPIQMALAKGGILTLE